MPVRKRDIVKQDLTRASSNIENAKEKLARWIDTYAEFHPEISAAFFIAVNNLTEIQEFIKKIDEAI